MCVLVCSNREKLTLRCRVVGSDGDRGLPIGGGWGEEQYPLWRPVWGRGPWDCLGPPLCGWGAAVDRGGWSAGGGGCKFPQTGTVIRPWTSTVRWGSSFLWMAGV